MSNLEEIAFNALEEMYQEADPPLDIEYVRANPDEMDENWYQQHYLDEDRQHEIVQKYSEKHDLSDREHTSLTMTAILDLGPTSNKELVEEE